MGGAQATEASGTLVHTFAATAFVDNFSLKDLAPLFPNARRGAHELRVDVDGEGQGEMFVFPFGAVVFRGVPEPRRALELDLLRKKRPDAFSKPMVQEEFIVRERPGAVLAVDERGLLVDELTPERRGVVALIVAQSAAMEYYEGIVDRLFARTAELVARLEQRGTVPLATRPLHRFIGAAIETRNEVLSVLHLLDKPDATWDDPGMDRIYNDLRAAFDLVDRYAALELELRSVQESLELILDVARDRRLVLLEVAIVVLIVIEIAMGIVRG